MFLRQVAPLIAVLSCIMPLTACEESTGPTSFAPRSGIVDPEAYGALPWTFPVVNEIRVVNEFGGDIIVTAREVPTAKEVALDYTAYGSGPDLVQAAADARRAVHVDMEYHPSDGAVIITALGSPLQESQTGQGVRLHVRVPHGVDLDLTTHDGSITVAGAVKSVLASATNRVEVRGAVGSLTLTATNGGIVADGGNGQHIHANSQNGGISIYSTDAQVTAAVTGSGGIEFVGTLAGQDNGFLTHTGPITIALPEDADYSFLVRTPNGRVITDFRPRKPNVADGRPVCGFVKGHQAYDYHVRYLDDIYSHLDINFANAGSSYLSGTLDANTYYLFTDRTEFTVYTPLPEVIHIYPDDGRESIDVNRPGQPLATADCTTPLPQPNVRFEVVTQSGLVFLHHILMRRQ